MKSIMEEASSIMEAIQKGWERAGKPQEFSVKVFEDAQTAFFGMRTVKSAKVALFFKEGTPSISQDGEAKPHRSSKSEEQFERAERQHRAPKQQQQKKPAPREAIAQPPRETTREAAQPKARPIAREPRAEGEMLPRGEWNNEMVGWVTNWVKSTLENAGKSEIAFSTEVSRNLLRIDFTEPVVGDLKQERILFSSFAHLIMSSLRNKFKGDLKHLKVVLNSK